MEPANQAIHGQVWVFVMLQAEMWNNGIWRRKDSGGMESLDFRSYFLVQESGVVVEGDFQRVILQECPGADTGIAVCSPKKKDFR